MDEDNSSVIFFIKVRLMKRILLAKIEDALTNNNAVVGNNLIG